MAQHSPFKSCPMCRQAWTDRREFLGDPDIKLVGYQPMFAQTELGLLLFNHSCGTTLVIEAGVFTDLYLGEVFEERLTQTDDCVGFCQAEENLEPCPRKCACAYVREVLQIVKSWPKTIRLSSASAT